MNERKETGRTKGTHKRKYVWAAVYSLLLTGFTVYVALDTFVITRVYTVVPSQENYLEDGLDAESEDNLTKERQEEFSSGFLSDSDSSSVLITENSYSDENISVFINEYREYDTSIYVADVQVTSAKYLKTALADNAYGKNVTEKTSEIAENNSAILAVNGDFYGSRESGYVIRNGILYRDTAVRGQEDLCIYEDGSFEIVAEDDVTANQLLYSDAAQVFSFGPALVTAGEISVTEDEEVGKAKASNPRTAVGIVDELHYVFVVSDGRTEESEGLSLYQLAEFMESLGCGIAYNLDGGGSSAMYFNGEIINNPTTDGKSIKERSVSDIVYIGY
jgi:exopolysaccharide biosynthesis protein